MNSISRTPAARIAGALITAAASAAVTWWLSGKWPDAAGAAISAGILALFFPPKKPTR